MGCPQNQKFSASDFQKTHKHKLCFFVVSIFAALIYHPKVALMKKKTASPLGIPQLSTKFKYRLSSPTCWAALWYRCRLFRRRLGAGKCWTLLRRCSSSRNCACFSDSELRGDGTTCGPQKRPDPHTENEGVGVPSCIRGRDRDGVLW